MDKVYLALEMVGLTAEKSKLEHDCREGASELKAMDVRITQCHVMVYSSLCSHSVFSVFSLPVCSCSKNAASWTRGRFSWQNNAKASWREQSSSARCKLTIHYQRTCIRLALICCCGGLCNHQMSVIFVYGSSSGDCRLSASCLTHWTRLTPCWTRSAQEPRASLALVKT